MTDDLHALAGPYALDAIDDAGERRLFEAHLAVCETCAAELREFRATTARLGMAVAEAPPPRLRDRVLADIGLRTLPSSEAYQLWLIGAGGPRSAGLLPDDRSRPVVAGTWRPSDRLGVTVEPAGGSVRPTTTPLVLLSPA